MAKQKRKKRLLRVKGANLAQYVHHTRVPNPDKPHEIVQLNQVGGGQVRLTPTVKKFAAQYSTPQQVHSIERIANSIKRKIQMKKVTPAEAAGLYARRTATDVIASQKALILDKEFRDKYVPMYGCVDYGLVLVATLKAHGIPAQFARRGHRSMVVFDFEGKKYLIDPSRHVRNSKALEMDKTAQRVFASLEENGAFGRGKDAWDIGMKSIRDFNKYVSLFDQGIIHSRS